MRCFFLGAIGAAVILMARTMSFTLGSVCNDIEKKYPSVRQITTTRLSSMISKNEAVVLFDVRDSKEFAVSHLERALRVEPLDGSGCTNFEPSQSDIQNKSVIFYCSVGMRSSQMAEKLQNKCKQLGAVSVYNLAGGIFAWHNEGRPLVNSKGTTDFVHPFNDRYKTLLLNQSHSSFTPHI